MTAASGPTGLKKAAKDAPAPYEYAAKRVQRTIRIGMSLSIPKKY